MDGESLVNRGMRLSPWEPPRFVLAGVQGVCGVQISTSKLAFNPLVPKDWKWVGLRRFPYNGQEMAFFGVRQPDGNHIYTTIDYEVVGGAQKHLYEEDMTTRVYTRNPLAQVIAFLQEAWRNPGVPGFVSLADDAVTDAAGATTRTEHYLSGRSLQQ